MQSFRLQSRSVESVIPILLASAALVAILPSGARADAPAQGDGKGHVEGAAPSGRTEVNRSREPARAPGLPPVLPGEEIDAGGVNMKVWSTGGEVSVAPLPSAPEAPSVGGVYVFPQVGGFGSCTGRGPCRSR